MSGFRNKLRERLSGFCNKEKKLLFCLNSFASVVGYPSGQPQNPAPAEHGECFLGWKLEQPNFHAVALLLPLGLTGKEIHADPNEQPSLERQ